MLKCKSNVIYTKEETDFILKQISLRMSSTKIAHHCNKIFHNNRPIRTYKSLDYFVQKVKIAKIRYEKKCEVCGDSFRTSWVNSRYCSSECRSVVERQYANKQYALNPAQNVSNQTKRNRIRSEKRWKIILKKFGDMCGLCKKTFPKIIYDLHHPNGKSSRKQTPSKVIRLGSDKDFEKMLLETVLLCANCHRLIHFSSGDWAPLRNNSVFDREKHTRTVNGKAFIKSH